MQDVNLAPFAPYVPAGSPIGLGAARVSADLEIDDPLAKSGRIKSKGTFDVKQIAVGTRALGKPFDLSLKPNVVVDPKGGVVDLTGFSVAIDDMKLGLAKEEGKEEGIAEAESRQGTDGAGDARMG